MNRIVKLLRTNSGQSFPMTIAITLAVLLIVCAVSEYMRLNIIASGVRDAVQSAVIATANDNYDDVYHGIREGYAGGWQPIDSGFEDSLDYGNMYMRLDELLGLARDGSYHLKLTSDGQLEYRLSELQVEIKNTPLAPSHSAYAEEFAATAQLKLEVPVSFGGKLLPPMQITLKVQAGWLERF